MPLADFAQKTVDHWKMELLNYDASFFLFGVLEIAAGDLHV